MKILSTLQNVGFVEGDVKEEIIVKLLENIGLLHTNCNVNYKIPIELHNLKNYDVKSYYARNCQI